MLWDEWVGGAAVQLCNCAMSTTDNINIRCRTRMYGVSFVATNIVPFQWPIRERRNVMAAMQDVAVHNHVYKCKPEVQMPYAWLQCKL